MSIKNTLKKLPEKENQVHYQCKATHIINRFFFISINFFSEQKNLNIANFHSN